MIQLSRDALEIDKTYSGNHTTSLSVLTYPLKGHILTIDQDGLILLGILRRKTLFWNSSWFRQFMIVKLERLKIHFRYRRPKMVFENGHLKARVEANRNQSRRFI